MFRRFRQTSHQVDTLIGAGTRIIGNVHFSGGFHIDGRVEGNVDAAVESGATLSVSDSGVVEGSVAVPRIILNGVVKGDIRAYERVELGATAQVTGNVHYTLIEMAVGAQIQGKLIHEAARPVSATPVPALALEGSASA